MGLMTLFYCLTVLRAYRIPRFKVKVTLRPTASQSWFQAPSVAQDQIFVTVDIGRPLWREGGCVSCRGYSQQYMSSTCSHFASRVLIHFLWWPLFCLLLTWPNELCHDLLKYHYDYFEHVRRRTLYIRSLNGLPWYLYFKVKVPVSWCQTPLGPRPNFCYCQAVAGLLIWGALSDERTGLLFSIAPRRRRNSRVGLVTTFYYLRFETPPTWRARSPYLYPPGTEWPRYTPCHWVPFSSPPTTLMATVEVFEPTSTQACLYFVRITLQLAVYRQSVRLGIHHKFFPSVIPILQALRLSR
jgi:hypothetical protein